MTKSKMSVISETVSLIISLGFRLLKEPTPPLLATPGSYTYWWLAGLLIGGGMALCFIIPWNENGKISWKKSVPALIVGALAVLGLGALYYWLRPDSQNNELLAQLSYAACVASLAFAAAFSFPALHSLYKP